MDPESEAPAQASDARGRAKRLIFEGVTVALVAALGIYHLMAGRKPDPQVGLVLVGLAMIFWLLRGRTIGKFAFGKDGVSAEFSELRAELRQTKRETHLVKTVLAEHAMGAPDVPASLQWQAEPAGASDEGAAAAERAGSGEGAGTSADEKTGPLGWAHPGLGRGPLVRNDPQKNQWGGSAENNDRRLSATVQQVDEDWFEIRLQVESTSAAKPLYNKVRFHLHNSFRTNPVVVLPVGGVARLKRTSYGAFTVGAEVEDEPATVLELDLAGPLVEAPARFKAR